MSLPENSPAPEPKPAQAPVVVKKYANRRLYNTESSSYITLDNLAALVRQGRDFVVYDAKTSEDITRGVLTQIIVEEESKGRAMLPTAFLRQIIGFYGDSLQQFVPSYLEQAMSSFAMQQEQMRSAMQQTMGNLFPGMQDIGRQNMAMMERAMNLFTPFYRAGAAAAAEAQQATPGHEHSDHEHRGDEQSHQATVDTTPTAASAAPLLEVSAMQREIETLRQQLETAKAAAELPVMAEVVPVRAPRKTAPKAAEKPEDDAA